MKQAAAQPNSISPSDLVFSLLVNFCYWWLVNFLRCITTHVLHAQETHFSPQA